MVKSDSSSGQLLSKWKRPKSDSSSGDYERATQENRAANNILNSVQTQQEADTMGPDQHAAGTATINSALEHLNK